MLKARQLSLPQLFIISIPIFLGLSLGFLASKGNWVFPLALAVLAPMAILFSSRPYLGVILWLLLMPLSSALPNPELMYWGLHRLLVPLTLCMALLSSMFRRSTLLPMRIGLVEVCMALLAAYVPLSILLAGTGMGQPLIKFADRMLIPFCMYLIMRLTVLRSSELRLLQWSAFFIAASQCAIAFLSLLAPQYLPYAWRPVLRGYAGGSLINPNVFAAALGFCICILFQAAMEHKSGFVKNLFIMTCGASVIGIFLSMERAAWLAGGLVLLGLLGLYPKFMIRFLLVAAVILLALGGLFFSQFTNMAAGRINNYGTINDRLIVGDAMLQMIQVKPIFGWGYETLNNHLKNFYRSVGAASGNIRFTTSHNTYLTIFTELGLVGFLLYLLPVVSLFIASVRGWRGAPRIGRLRWLLLAIFWLAALQNMVISNFMDMRFFPIGITLWWMNLGLIANLLDQHAEVLDRRTTYQAAQKSGRVQPIDQLLLENNEPNWN